MAHPWFDTQDFSTTLIPITRNPDWRDGWVGATCDNLNLWEEAVEDAHSARCDEEGDEDDTVLSYAVIEEETDGHDSGGTRYYLHLRLQA